MDNHYSITKSLKNNYLSFPHFQFVITAIIKDATITIRDSNLIKRTELSATVAFNKRNKSNTCSNVSKVGKALGIKKPVVTNGCPEYNGTLYIKK